MNSFGFKQILNHNGCNMNANMFIPVLKLSMWYVSCTKNTNVPCSHDYIGDSNFIHLNNAEFCYFCHAYDIDDKMVKHVLKFIFRCI